MRGIYNHWAEVGGGGGRGAQRKGVDEGSDFSEVLGLFDEESDNASDGDDVLPGLSACSDQLRDASGFSEAVTAEYMHVLRAKDESESLRFTTWDVTVAHSSQTM